MFLFNVAEFENYDELIRGEDRDPEPISQGSAQGIEESATRTVTLEGAQYYLVVDNSDYGDAGDFGTEDTRRVTIAVETRKA